MQKGTKHKKESREAIAKTLSGKKLSDEQKEKMSQSAKARHQRQRNLKEKNNAVPE